MAEYICLRLFITVLGLSIADLGPIIPFLGFRITKLGPMAQLYRKKKMVSDVVSIRKSNDLVEARYRFDIWETRVFIKMLSLIKRDDKDFQEYKIYVRDLLHEFNLRNDKNSYTHIKAGAEKLMRKIIKVVMKDEGNLVEFQTPIVGSLKNTVEEGEGSYIKIGFHPDMKPHLLELQERFLIYDIRNVSNLRSPYYVRMYELLKQYEKLGQRKFELKELKEILGIEAEYKLYGHFKSKIIDKSQVNLLEHTDISFTYEEMKRGKSVHSILFFIRSNRPKHLDAGQANLFNPPNGTGKTAASRTAGPLTDDAQTEKNQLFDELQLAVVKGWGVTPLVLAQLIQDNDENVIRQAVEVTRAAIRWGKVHETAGYFVQAVKQKWTNRQIETLRRETDARERKSRIEILNHELDDLLDEFEGKKNERIRQLTTDDAGVTEAAIEAIKQTEFVLERLKNLGIETPTTDDFRLDKGLRAAVKNQIARQHPAHFEEVLMEYEPKIGEIERELAELRLSTN